jgi:hypothetical protein
MTILITEITVLNQWFLNFIQRSPLSLSKISSRYLLNLMPFFIVSFLKSTHFRVLMSELIFILSTQVLRAAETTDQFNKKIN